jgi:hypothetical protein
VTDSPALFVVQFDYDITDGATVTITPATTTVGDGGAVTDWTTGADALSYVSNTGLDWPCVITDFRTECITPFATNVASVTEWDSVYIMPVILDLSARVPAPVVSAFDVSAQADGEFCSLSVPTGQSTSFGFNNLAVGFGFSGILATEASPAAIEVTAGKYRFTVSGIRFA